MSIQVLGRQVRAITLAGLCALVLTACGNFASDGKTTYPEDDNRKKGDNLYDQEGVGSVFGDDGLNLFGEETTGPGGGGSGIGVNSYLWRASLDTISFMPLASAGGPEYVAGAADPSSAATWQEAVVRLEARISESEARAVAATRPLDDALERIADRLDSMETYVLRRSRRSYLSRLLRR